MPPTKKTRAKALPPEPCGKDCGHWETTHRAGMTFDPPLIEQAYCGLIKDHEGACYP